MLRPHNVSRTSQNVSVAWKFSSLVGSVSQVKSMADPKQSEMRLEIGSLASQSVNGYHLTPSILTLNTTISVSHICHLSTTNMMANRLVTVTLARRSLHTTPAICSSAGFFVRPVNAPTSSNASSAPQPRPIRPVAQVHTPEHIPAEQAPNFPTTWSESQNPRQNAMKGPRFEQLDMRFQPQPLAAIEMIQREPIRLSSKRIAACDGGGGPLGHPKVFINLDKPGPKPCPYW